MDIILVSGNSVVILVLYSIDWLVQLWIWPCLKSSPLPASCNIIMQGFNQGSGWKIIDSDLFLVAKLSYVCSSNWRTLSKHYFYSVVGLGHNGWIAFPTWICIDLYCRYEHTFKTDIVNVESDPLLQETNLLDGANHMGFKMSKVKFLDRFGTCQISIWRDPYNIHIYNIGALAKWDVNAIQPWPCTTCDAK